MLCRWGATPLQDAYLSGDQVMGALLERAGGKMADHPTIKDKLPAHLVCCKISSSCLISPCLLCLSMCVACMVLRLLLFVHPHQV